MKTDIAIVPHPSGLNRFWNNPPKKKLKVLRRIRKTIIRTVEPTVTKAQYSSYVLEKIPGERIYCKECRVKWPKTRVKPSQAYSIYLRDPEGHVLYVFCLDCKMPHKRDEIRVHERGGRETMFCPKGHKIKLELTMKELKDFIS